MSRHQSTPVRNEASWYLSGSSLLCLLADLCYHGHPHNTLRIEVLHRSDYPQDYNYKFAKHCRLLLDPSYLALFFAFFLYGRPHYHSIFHCFLMVLINGWEGTREALPGENTKIRIFEFSINFWIFELSMAVLGPGRVSMAFPEPVRSYFTPHCLKPTHLYLTQPQNYIFRHFVLHFSELVRKNPSHTNPQTKPIG